MIDIREHGGIFGGREKPLSTEGINVGGNTVILTSYKDKHLLYNPTTFFYYLTKTDGTEIASISARAELPNWQRVTHPHLSPDGSRLVFCVSDNQSYRTHVICVFSTDKLTKIATKTITSSFAVSEYFTPMMIDNDKVIYTKSDSNVITSYAITSPSSTKTISSPYNLNGFAFTLKVFDDMTFSIMPVVNLDTTENSSVRLIGFLKVRFDSNGNMTRIIAKQINVNYPQTSNSSLLRPPVMGDYAIYSRFHFVDAFVINMRSGDALIGSLDLGVPNVISKFGVTVGNKYYCMSEGIGGFTPYEVELEDDGTFLRVVKAQIVGSLFGERFSNNPISGNDNDIFPTDLLMCKNAIGNSGFSTSLQTNKKMTFTK